MILLIYIGARLNQIKKVLNSNIKKFRNYAFKKTVELLMWKNLLRKKVSFLYYVILKNIYK